MDSYRLLYKNSSGCEIIVFVPISDRKDAKWIEIIQSQIADWLSDSPSISLKTSGSTGQAKIIQLSKRSMQESAKRTANYFQLYEKTSAVLCLPAQYIAGLMMIVRSLVNGWKLYCFEPSMSVDVSSIGDLDFIAMTPSQLTSSLEFAAKNKISLIRKVLIGGGGVDPVLMEKISMLDCAVYHSYGMTETCTHIAIRRLNGNESSESFTVLERIKLSIDERSCLQIESNYLDEPLYQTNDIVELLSSREFIWKGRADFVINSGGVKLFPEEIEKKIKTIFPDLVFFISSEKDELLGQKLVLIVDVSSYYNKIDILNVLKLSKRMDKYELPKAVYFVPQIFFTDSGKIKRQKDLYLDSNN